MVLTRQGVPVLAETAAKAKDGVKKALTSWSTQGTPDVILMASGSSPVGCGCAKTLAGEGVKARVVSVPSMEWFEEQDAEYKEAVLPAAVKARVSVEAGVAMPWYKYLGSYGKPVSIEQFGLQGDGAQNMIDLASPPSMLSKPPRPPLRKSKPPSDSTGRGMMHVPLPFYRTINKDLIQKGIKEKNND